LKGSVYADLGLAVCEVDGLEEPASDKYTEVLVGGSSYRSKSKVVPISSMPLNPLRIVGITSLTSSIVLIYTSKILSWTFPLTWSSS
jgi:hypothetical protein